MIQWLVLKEGDVELVGDEARRDVVRKLRMALDGRQRSSASALVCRGIGVSDSQRERGVVIKEERSDMIIENEEENVWLLLCEPVAYGLIAFEDRSPNRIVLFLAIKGEADCRRMRAGDSTYNFCHNANTLPLYDRGKA